MGTPIYIVYRCVWGRLYIWFTGVYGVTYIDGLQVCIGTPIYIWFTGVYGDAYIWFAERLMVYRCLWGRLMVYRCVWGRLYI